MKTFLEIMKQLDEAKDLKTVNKDGKEMYEDTLHSYTQELIKTNHPDHKIFKRATTLKGDAYKKYAHQQDTDVRDKLLQYVKEDIGGSFKNASDWESSAKARGLIVKSATHPSGEMTKYQIAKDKNGNNRGHFDYGKNSGMIKEESLDEVLSKDSSAGEWISDFIKSDNPKFAGKSKEKRKEMALAAYYANQRNEEVELDEANGPPKATLAFAKKQAFAAALHNYKKGMANDDLSKFKTDLNKKKIANEDFELDESFMKSHSMDMTGHGNAVAAHKVATEIAKDSGGKLEKVNALHHNIDFGGGHTASIKTIDGGRKITTHVVHRHEYGFKEEFELDESDDMMKRIHKEYTYHKSRPTADVLKTHKGLNRVQSKNYSAGEMGGKEGLISDIMHHAHGKTRMAAYHAMKPSERKSLGEDFELDEDMDKSHIEQHLANKDINSQVTGKTVKVHSSDVTATKRHLKRAGYDHSVVGGLNEEVEELEELSKDTLSSYAHKAFAQGNDLHQDLSYMRGNKATDAERKAIRDKISKRNIGVIKASQKMNKEDVELNELSKDLVNRVAKARSNNLKDALDASDRRQSSSSQAQSDKKSNDMLKKYQDSKAVQKIRNEAVDTVKKDASGKVIAWSHEGDWEKMSNNNKQGSSKAANLASKALQRTKQFGKEDPSARNSDGTPQSRMSKVRALAKQAMKNQMKEDFELDEAYRMPSDSEINKVKLHVKANHPDKTLSQISVHRKTKNIEYVVKDKEGKMSGHSLSEAKDDREYGYEGEMVMTQLKTLCRHADNLMGMLKPNTDLPEWVQSKITLATDYMQTAHDYLRSDMNESLDEAAWGNDKMTNLRQAHDRHMEKALAANRAGDDEAVKTHQRKMQMIQGKMQKLKRNEEIELEEKRGLWDNIHAKRKRIKAGSGERMRKPGSEGAPTDRDFKNASESVEYNMKSFGDFMLELDFINEGRADDVKDKLAAAREKRLSSYDYSKEKEKPKSNVTVHKARYNMDDNEKDEDDEVKKSAEPDVKRGRGRPKGFSGSYKRRNS